MISGPTLTAEEIAAFQAAWRAHREDAEPEAPVIIFDVQRDGEMLLLWLEPPQASPIALPRSSSDLHYGVSLRHERGAWAQAPTPRAWEPAPDILRALIEALSQTVDEHLARHHQPRTRRDGRGVPSDPAAAIEVLASDRIFQDSPDAGAPTCLCSRCALPIAESVIPIRLRMAGNSELRYHPFCVGVAG